MLLEVKEELQEHILSKKEEEKMGTLKHREVETVRRETSCMNQTVSASTMWGSSPTVDISSNGASNI